MIAVKKTESSIEIRGHARQDICAAVSCLTQTLHMYLKDKNVDHLFKIEPGHTFISYDGRDKSILDAFRFVSIRLDEMINVYNDFIKEDTYD